MNLITFGFSEKGSPIFLNQEPYQQVGTMYLMKAGDNSIIGITLDDKAFQLNKRGNGVTRRTRKAKAAEPVEAPKKRGRKVKTEAEAVPKRRGRKSTQAKEKPARMTRNKKEEVQALVQ